MDYDACVPPKGFRDKDIPVHARSTYFVLRSIPESRAPGDVAPVRQCIDWLNIAISKVVLTIRVPFNSYPRPLVVARIRFAQATPCQLSIVEVKTGSCNQLTLLGLVP
jgi:hypothetical protein